jgi:hypothetical protein
MSRGHHLYPRVVEEVVVERDHNRCFYNYPRYPSNLDQMPKTEEQKIGYGKGSYKPYPSIQLA